MIVMSFVEKKVDVNANYMTTTNSIHNIAVLLQHV